MTGEPLTELERRVLYLLLAGEDPVLNVLRRQLLQCRATRREMTGVGFFTDLHVPHATPRLQNRSRLVFGDVQAHMAGLAHGAGFLVFVEQGALTMLEGYTNGDEKWPDRVEDLRITYEGGTRDMEALRRQWLE